MIQKKEFEIIFALSKTTFFKVSNQKLKGNKAPDFATSGYVFNQPKTDFSRCGQCQDNILKKYPLLKNFYLKWDVLHLKELNELQYKELIEDIEKLSTHYSYIYIEADEYCKDISFDSLKKFSMKVFRNKEKIQEKITD